MLTARDFQFRCPTCGRTRCAEEVGMIRLGGVSIGRRTLGWCSVCRRLRMLIIERKPVTTSAR